MRSVEDTVASLTHNWGGRVVSRRPGEAVIQIGGCLMLVSEMKRTEAVSESDYPRLHCCQGRACPHGEAVFNICLEVGDVEAAVARMRDRGTRLIVPPTSLASDLGVVTCAVVSSPCDNVIHSLVNTSGFRGQFLPGFEDVTSESDGSEEVAGLTHVDHVTYVCRRGESEAILAWYRDTCGMAAFSLAGETEELGLEAGWTICIRHM